MNGARSAIGEVVVAGGGIVGWSAAAALRRHLPWLSVTLVTTQPSPAALAERIGSTLPSAVIFHEDIGLSEANTVLRTGSGYRLGTSFEGWASDPPSYVHVYGQYGRPIGSSAFHHHWARAACAAPSAPFDAYSPAALMARAARFVHPHDHEASPLATFEYGLQLNLPGYLQMIRAYGRHLGVRERGAALAEVRLRGEDGFIDSLLLDDGSEVRGDLFLDCTGPEALVRSVLGGEFVGWSRWLLCDRMLLAGGPSPPDLPVIATATADAGGWRWEAASPAGGSRGIVYSAAHTDDEAALRSLRAEPSGSPISIRQGRLGEAWVRNCVAVGDAGVAVEPLEWTNLHLAHSAIDRIVASLPDREFAPVELGEYNRLWAAEADRVRDFLALHYLTAKRSEPFWRDAAAAEPPPSLAHTLRLFGERGRLPFYEEETFGRDSWLAVLLGQGVMPRRADPLTDSVAPEVAEAAMARMRSGFASLVASLPTHSAYLQNFAARAQR